MLRAVAAVAAAVLSSGCLVLSLQPAYDDKSIAFDEALLGKWSNTEDQTLATIERGEWRSYKITYVDHSTTRTFQGNLTTIGAMRLLDVTESRGADPGPYLVPVHGLFRIELDGDRLTAAALDYQWFTRAMAQKTIKLPVSFDDRRNAVLAASTADLRRWLAKPAADVFGDAMTFERAK